MQPVNILIFVSLFSLSIYWGICANENESIKDDKNLDNMDIENIKFENLLPEDSSKGRFVKNAKIPGFLKGWTDPGKIFVPDIYKNNDFYEEVLSQPVVCSSLKKKMEDSKIYAENWKISYEDKSKKYTMNLFYKKDNKKWYVDFSGKKVECSIHEFELKSSGIKGIHELFSGFFCTQEGSFNKLKKGDFVLMISFEVSQDSDKWDAFFYFKKKEDKLSYLGGYYCNEQFFASF